MSNFEKAGGSFSLELTLDEAHILINLAEQLLELLGEGDFFHHYDTSDPLVQLLAMPSEIVTPEDPVLLRLLPNAYADPEAASDFRRYTEPALRLSKQRNTETQAYPSRTDIAYASEPGAHYVLVSTRKEIAPENEFRSYRIIDGVVTEEPVQIISEF